MKKIRSFFMCMAAIAVIFVGCKEKYSPPQPKITVNNGDSIQFDLDMRDSLSIPITITSEDNLKTVQAYITDRKANIYAIDNDIVFDRPTKEFEKIYTIQDFESEKLPPADSFKSFIVASTTTENITASKETPFSLKNFRTTLSEARKFEWQRVGDNQAVGLEQFGLKWNRDVEGKAIIERDNAEKFVQLSENQWTNISNKEQLRSYINISPAIEIYNEISVENNYIYNTVLATIVDGTCFLIHITGSSIVRIEEVTTITISGSYKK